MDFFLLTMEADKFDFYNFKRFKNSLKILILANWGYGVAWIILSGLGPDDPGSNIPEGTIIPK